MGCNRCNELFQEHDKMGAILNTFTLLVQLVRPIEDNTDWRRRYTPGETEYEWKKTEQVPIQLPNIVRTL